MLILDNESVSTTHYSKNVSKYSVANTGLVPQFISKRSSRKENVHNLLKNFFRKQNNHRELWSLTVQNILFIKQRQF